MSLTDTEIMKLRKAIAQQEITAIIYRLARGLDRRDKSLWPHVFMKARQMIMGYSSALPLTFAIGSLSN